MLAGSHEQAAGAAGDQLPAPAGAAGAARLALGYIPSRGDAYEDCDGCRRRLLYIEPPSPERTPHRPQRTASAHRPRHAWLIAFGPGTESAIPQPLELGEFLAYLQPANAIWRRMEPVQLGAPAQRKLSDASVAARKLRWDKLHQRVDKIDGIENICMADDVRLLGKPGRKKLLKLYEKALGVTDKTLLLWLRLYWKGGFRQDGLLPDFPNCGENLNELDPEVRAQRAAPGRDNADGNRPYPFTVREQKRVLRAATFLRAKYTKRKDFYDLLAKRWWSYVDQNGKAHLLPAGQMPSRGQIYALLRKHLGKFGDLKRKAGPGKWESDFEGRTGTVLQEAVCVGHQYEIDSTIADIWLVSAENRNKIIGKPTLYFVVDRFSRLVVGWHATLDSPSWHGAREALLSIFEDPQALCRTLGVRYKPHLYPAAGVAPAMVVADRGTDFICEMTDALPRELHIAMVNMPAHICPPKGTVECTFLQHHVSLRSVAPGYQPPAEAMKRHGQNYEHDAEWTLDKFKAEVLAFVNYHNEKIQPRMPQRLHAVFGDAQPTAIDVWNHNVTQALGMLTRLDASEVYWALLHQQRGAVTGEGIRVRGLYYTCREIEKLEWLVQGGIKRFPVHIKLDRRRTDHVYVLNPDAPGEYFVAHLTPKCEMFGRRSFAEAEAALAQMKKLGHDADRRNLELQLQYDHERRGREVESEKLAKQAIADAKTRGESRISERPEIRGQEAAQRSLAEADERHRELLEKSSPPQPTSAPSPTAPSPREAAAVDPLPKSMDEAVVIEDPMAALRNMGH
jgi:putative transposase